MAYLGNSPGVASQRVETAFTATSNQTVFTPTSGYTLGYCDVYQNGVKLVNGDDYTASDGVTVTLATGAASGDSIVIVASFPRGLSDGYLKSEADARYSLVTDSSATANGVLYRNGSKALTNGSALVFDGTNLGIGASSPGTLLHILSGTQEQIRLGRSSTASSGYLTFFANNSSSAQVQYAGILGDVASSTAGSHGGNLLFYTTGSGTSAERARIDSSGRLIVGGTTAYGAAATFTAGGASVVVNQTVSSAYAGYRIYNDIGSAFRALEINYAGSAYSGSLLSGGPSGESASIATTGAYPLSLGTNNTSRLTIASDGNMTMSGTIRPAAILSPNTSTVVTADNAMPSAANSFLYTLAGGPGNNDGHMLGMTWTSASTYGAQLWFDTDPTYLMAMRQRNNLGAWNAWSYLLNTNTYKVYTASGGTSSSSSGTRASVTFTLNSASNKILVLGSDLLRCTSGWLRGIVLIDSTTVEGEFMYQQANGNLWQTTTGITTINNAAAGSHTISLYAEFANGGGAWDGPTYLQVIVWDGI